MDPSQRLQKYIDSILKILESDNPPGYLWVTAHVLKFFKYYHLHDQQRLISSRVCTLVCDLLDDVCSGDPLLIDPEFNTGLRKLLEAKDCMVRSSL